MQNWDTRGIFYEYIQVKTQWLKIREEGTMINRVRPRRKQGRREKPGEKQVRITVTTHVCRHQDRK